mmetsp:Transcript_7378/g.11211  ORF Transcript_7378/g.11211 Transcript_7378/m.11211 type:complete len:91 (+) Transcript_7378:519-791(+)
MVAGLSLDYVKCFELIPQIVVLHLAAELGMGPEVCRALAAVYRRLQRALKLASNCVGPWWWTTNGILQRCPLSVVLGNWTHSAKEQLKAV